MRYTINASLFETNEFIQYDIFDKPHWSIKSGFLSAGSGGYAYATHSTYVSFFLAMHRARVELISIYEPKLIEWSLYVCRS